MFNTLLDIQRDYFRRIFEDVDGLKVLVLDERSTAAICLLFSKSELWNYNVFLIEQITNLSQNKDTKKLKSVVIIQPNAENIKLIEKNLHTKSLTTCYICKFYFC